MFKLNKLIINNELDVELNALAVIFNNDQPRWSSDTLEVKFGYTNKRSFIQAIDRAKYNASLMGHNVDYEFMLRMEDYVFGRGGVGKKEVYYLTAFACSMVAMYADYNKPGVNEVNRWFAARLQRICYNQRKGTFNRLYG